jgi:hypothetical protein
LDHDRLLPISLISTFGPELRTSTLVGALLVFTMRVLPLNYSDDTEGMSRASRV